MGRALHAARNHRFFVMKSPRRIGSLPGAGLRFARLNHEIETSKMGFNGQFVHRRNFTPRTSAQGHSTKSLRDSLEVRLILSH
jgi:hypothetical protein